MPLWRYCAARDTLCWHGIQCRRYICPEALDPTYDFAEGGTYHTLANGDLAAYREYVRSLPLADIPEVIDSIRWRLCCAPHGLWLPL